MLTRRTFLKVLVATPVIAQGLDTLLAPASVTITRNQYADLFVKRLSFIDDILMEQFEQRAYFGSCRSGKTDALIWDSLRPGSHGISA